MQATSSWATRKNEKIKEIEEFNEK